MMKTAADVTASAGAAAIVIMDSGASMTATVKSAAVGLFSASLHAMEAAWHGLDLLDVRLNASSIKVMAASEADLARWVLANVPIVIPHAPPEAVMAWASMISSLSMDVPAIAHQTEAFDEHSSFVFTEITGILESNGYFVIVAKVAVTGFSAQWANPLWSALDLNVSNEANQIRGIPRRCCRSICRRTFVPCNSTSVMIA